MGGNALVTGGSGFIGNRLLELLGGSYRINLLDRSRLSEQGYLDRLMENVSTVIHLAAQIRGEEEEIVKGNVGFTKILLEAISRIPGRKPTLVFTSTFAVFAPSRKILTENSPTGPSTPYGQAKLETENIVREYSKKFGIPVTILRLANVYGPGIPPHSHSVIATFIEQALNNSPITIDGDGSQKRDFVYVDDVVDALKKAAAWVGGPGEVETIIIASGVGVSIKDLARKIIGFTGSKSVVSYFHPEVREVGVWIGDPRRAEAVLSWRPLTSLDRGLRLTCEACKKD